MAEIMKETVARTKVCPFIATDEVLKYYGSGCMAWRWVETPEFKRHADYLYSRDGTISKTDEGVCGRVPLAY